MYRKHIFTQLVIMGRADVDPRHVEAWMRLTYNTLDWMSFETFRKEISIAVGCIDHVGRIKSERLAESFAL